MCFREEDTEALKRPELPQGHGSEAMELVTHSGLCALALELSPLDKVSLIVWEVIVCHGFTA